MNVLKWVGALALLGVLSFTAFINVRGIPRYARETITFTAEATPARLERGRELVNTLCTNCHISAFTDRLTGRDMRLLEYGDVWSLNITQSKESGIGEWSDAELAYLLRTGVGRDGTYTMPWMPKYPQLADEDLKSIIAFLRSPDQLVLPLNLKDHLNVYSFITKLLANTTFKPLPYPSAPVEKPNPSDPVAVGKYYALGFGCFTCHSASFKSVNLHEPEKSADFFGGGGTFTDFDRNEVYAPNLTMDAETGLGSWTEEQFVRAMRAGILPSGRAFRDPMGPYPMLTEHETRALWAYLKTVPVIRKARPTFSFNDSAATSTAPGLGFFRKYGCNSCHGQAGVGSADLSHASDHLATEGDLVSFIRKPLTFNQQSRMPTYDGLIPADELNAIVEYVKTLQRIPFKNRIIVRLPDAGASSPDGGIEPAVDGGP